MRRTLVFLLAAVAVGCPRPSQHPIPAERVRVERVQLDFVADDEARLSVELSVFNASQSPQQLADLQWELWLDGRPFASGVRAVSVSVAPSSWASVKWAVPLTFRSDVEGRATRRVTIGLRGSVHAYTGGFEERLKFQRLEARVVAGAPSASAAR